VHSQVQAFLRGAGALQVTLPELHDEATGRVDAQKVANYMGVPLARLAQALRLNYKALHRNPSAEAAQAALKPVKRSLEILHEFFQKSETVRVWLNTPHPDLDGHSALEMILVNNSNAVLRVLENAAAGVPV
jgi:Antitoxin Xre/MbcA/ParS C-terminal toxin-binding domain